METNYTQQEILLITNSIFSSRQLCEKNDSENPRLTQTEQLEEACWNGLLRETLPEVFPENGNNRTLYLWKITHTKSFLEIELAEFPATKDRYYSIDPYSFLEGQSYN